MAAGHETTANALSWTLLLLSRHPLARRRLEAEVDEVLGGRAPTIDDVPKLVYTRWVIEESLRLYPPAWATGRVAIERHVLERESAPSFDVPKGTFMFLSPWVTHHRPDLFEDPEGFDPERWERLGKPGALHAFAFFPFGGGPRKCVGEAFAYLEATIVLAMIASRLRFDLVPAQVVEPAPQITLGLKHGLAMDVVRREA
jgi:cytochrome P450